MDETVNDNSFDNLQIDEKLKTSALFTNLRHGEIETEIDQTNDEVFHAMLANINSDLLNYKDAMHTKDNKLWQDAIDDELRSMKKNKVWKLVKRPVLMENSQSVNILDSRWVFKRKTEADGEMRYKAHLVIRGFKDNNDYELRET